MQFLGQTVEHASSKLLPSALSIKQTKQILNLHVAVCEKGMSKSWACEWHTDLCNYHGVSDTLWASLFLACCAVMSGEQFAACSVHGSISALVDSVSQKPL